MTDESAPPAVHVWRSEDDTHWTVQVDTGPGTGPVAVDLNDGRLFHGDPETFDAASAARKALHKSGPAGGLDVEALQIVVDAVRGELEDRG